MVTDIVQSTSLARLVGDEWPAVLARHDELVDRACSPFDGRRSGFTGDGFSYVFDDAGAAVSAAVRTVQDIDAGPWPDGAAVRVRIGLHAGPVHETAGVFSGVTIHEAARVAALAGTGRVLISEAVRSSLAEPPQHLRIVDLGPHEVRDLPGPTRLYSVEPVDAIEAELGEPLEAPGATPLLGRGEALESLRSELDQTRVLSVVGPGRHRQDEARDRAAPHARRGRRAGRPHPARRRARARAGPRRRPGRSRGGPGSTAAEAIGSRSILLVLDNCEHVASGGALAVRGARRWLPSVAGGDDEPPGARDRRRACLVRAAPARGGRRRAVPRPRRRRHRTGPSPGARPDRCRGGVPAGGLHAPGHRAGRRPATSLRSRRPARAPRRPAPPAGRPQPVRRQTVAAASPLPSSRASTPSTRRPRRLPCAVRLPRRRGPRRHLRGACPTTTASPCSTPWRSWSTPRSCSDPTVRTGDLATASSSRFASSPIAPSPMRSGARLQDRHAELGGADSSGRPDARCSCGSAPASSSTPSRPTSSRPSLTSSPPTRSPRRCGWWATLATTGSPSARRWGGISPSECWMRRPATSPHACAPTPSSRPVSWRLQSQRFGDARSMLTEALELLGD